MTAMFIPRQNKFALPIYLSFSWNPLRSHETCLNSIIFSLTSASTFFIVSYSENDSFEMWAHNYWNFENLRWLLFCPHIYQPILGNIDGDFVICLEYMEHTWHKNSNQISIIQVLIDVMRMCSQRWSVSEENVGNGLNWPPSPAEVARMCSVSQIHELRRK